jgi:hypothetical protein
MNLVFSKRVFSFLQFPLSPPHRNDLYLILERGEFEKGGKSTGKNIEVTVQVLDSDGTVLQVRVNTYLIFINLLCC